MDCRGYCLLVERLPSLAGPALARIGHAVRPFTAALPHQMPSTDQARQPNHDAMSSQAVDATEDGGALLQFGQQSDDLASRLLAVVVHVYTSLPQSQSARKAAQLSPTLEVSMSAVRPPEPTV